MSLATISDSMADWLIANADRALARFVPECATASDALQVGTRLRKHYAAEQARLLGELWELRMRGATKFSQASRMFFHRRGLEQATDEKIASYKASRFAPVTGPVIDLCCGIGGDSIYLARQKEGLTVVDLDSVTARFAVANARLDHDLPIQPICKDVRDVPLDSFAAWHIDPDRRPGERRHSDPTRCDPPLMDFLQLPGRSGNGAIKLAPAAEVDWLLQRGVELEWIGHDRECQQLVAWFGELAQHPGKRTATWIQGDHAESYVEASPGSGVRRSDQLLAYLFEPLPCLLAAGLDQDLAQQQELRDFTGRVAYYTSEHHPSSSWGTTFRVIEDQVFRPKLLKQRLLALGAQVGEVKKRGVPIDPALVQRQCRKVRGALSVVLIFYPHGNSVRVAITQRL